MRFDEYAAHDATGLAALVAAGEVSAAELLATARERSAAVNPRINAIIRDIPEADAQAEGPLAGPFAGVPFLIKDLGQDYAGHPSTSGSRSRRNLVASEHATVTRRFLDAGLVVFGKTNTPEFGITAVTESELFGPARSPWDTGRTPGGSSGGSAAAVAAGIVPAAGANDGGGSIRIPAACTGLVGFKVSRGLSPYGPREGEMLFGMAVQGVLTRTVRDAAGLYDAIVGPGRASEYVAAMPSAPWSGVLGEDPGRLRIGFSAESSLKVSPDHEARLAVERAATLLESLGHEVTEVPVPHDDAALARDFLTIFFAQTTADVATSQALTGARDSEFEAGTLAAAELGRAGGALALARALSRRNVYIRDLERFHETYDLFMTPTIAKPPLPIGALEAPEWLKRGMRLVSALRSGRLVKASGMLDSVVDESLGWVPYTQLANLTGQPAVSLPLHWTAGGLPLGVKFLAPLGGDALLLRLAAQLEEAQPWNQRFPALAADRGRE